MKKILITGANSYVGTSFEKWLSQWPDEYHVDTIDMIDGTWREKSFAGYDVVFHVAGIAHVSVTSSQKDMYYKINRDLAIETAQKVKAAGARQFIFMSSIIIYGDSAPIGEKKIITKDTPATPTNFYGDSKLQAEIGILALKTDSFNVVILRPPMIYGKGSKGNFHVLENVALKLAVFPKVNNSRSMLYIGNLVEFVRLMIDNEESGIFWPCDKEWCNISAMVKMIAEAKGKKIRLIGGLGWALKLMSHITGLVNKAFGNLTYEEHMGDYAKEYRSVGLVESIRETEK